jgi:hypothetical protein
MKRSSPLMVTAPSSGQRREPAVNDLLQVVGEWDVSDRLDLGDRPPSAVNGALVIVDVNEDGRPVLQSLICIRGCHVRLSY